LSAFKTEGEKTKVFELKNNKEETRKITELIKEELAKGIPEEEICVMFRTHQQSRALKSVLEYEKIPFTSVTKRSLLKITPIRLTLDYLSILSKLKNKTRGGEQAWWDLIHNSSFNKQDAIIISKFIKENKKQDCISVKMLNNLTELPLSEKGKIQTQIIIKTIKSLLPYLSLPISELILRIYEISRIRDTNSEITNKEKTVILKAFHELAVEYSSFDSPDISSFLHHIDIISSLGIEIEAPSIENKGIRIMTNHATKGLEYRTVIIGSLAQKRFPIERISNTLLPAELSPELPDNLKGLNENEKEEIIKQHKLENQLLEEKVLFCTGECYIT
jgi:DNA helicase-2/ATP-dependent DNA helicase PcrA